MGMIFGDDFPEDITERAVDLGRRLVLAWRNKESFPEIKEEFRHSGIKCDNLWIGSNK